jgi:hypothetical protein
LTGNERRFDRGDAVCGGAADNEAGIEVHVGVIAGNFEGKLDASGWGNRQAHRGASRFDIERKADVERDRKLCRAIEDGGLRAAFLFKRKVFPFLTRVENGDAGVEGDFCFAFGEGFALQLHRAHSFVFGDLEFELGALDGIRERCSFDVLRRLAGELDEAVVLFERKRDATRGRHGNHFVLCPCGRGQQKCDYQREFLQVFHRPPAFFSFE